MKGVKIMGAIAGVIFFICLLFVGLVGIGLGIAGLIFKGVLKRKQKSGSGALGAISIIVIVVSSLIALVPICFFSFIIFINNTLPF